MTRFQWIGLRGSLGLSIGLSVLFHFLFLLLSMKVLIESGYGERWRSVLERRRIAQAAGGSPGGRIFRLEMIEGGTVVPYPETLRPGEEGPPATVRRSAGGRFEGEGGIGRGAGRGEGGRGAAGAPSGGPRHFVPDSLDIRLSFPWRSPGEEPSRSPMPTGLQRALEALREEERSRAEKETLSVDTRYGPFGISPGGLHLGPLVIPIPFSPYGSIEARQEEETHREIQEQGDAPRDPDLREQRERILEWKKRGEGGG